MDVFVLIVFAAILDMALNVDMIAAVRKMHM